MILVIETFSTPTGIVNRNSAIAGRVAACYCHSLCAGSVHFELTFYYRQCEPNGYRMALLEMPRLQSRVKPHFQVLAIVTKALNDCRYCLARNWPLTL